jgi:hypothetical protein
MFDVAENVHLMMLDKTEIKNEYFIFLSFYS